MWIQRDLRHKWNNEAAQPVRVLFGLRQIGKTAFLRNLAEGTGRTFVSFDDVGTRESARRDPSFFLNSLGNNFIIDEAQYVPEIFSQLKIRVDELKERRIKKSDASSPKELSCWLTGSNRVLIDKQVAESLTGRASYFEFHGLSAHEIHQTLGPITFSDLAFSGGWPELYIDGDLSKTQYVSDFISTSLEKDIAAIGIEKVASFIRLLRFAAGRIGGIFDLQDVAKDSGISIPTATGWLAYATRMNILLRADAYSTNITKRLIKSPKYYFYEPSLVTRLQGWSESMPLLISPVVGHHFENMVAAEIAKTRANFLPSLEITHWRTKEREEVDFLVSCNSKLLGIEAKYSAREAATVQLPMSIQAIKNVDGLAVSFDGPNRGQNSILPHVSLWDLGNYLRQYFGATAQKSSQL